MRPLPLVLLAALFLAGGLGWLVISSDGNKAGPVGAATVLVLNQKGEPVPGVYVAESLTDGAPEFVELRAKYRFTDEEGRARFTDLPVGKHVFGIDLDRFIDWQPPSNSESKTIVRANRIIDNFNFLKLALKRKLIELNSTMEQNGFVTQQVLEYGDIEVRLVVPSLNSLEGTVSDTDGPISGAIVRLYLESEHAIDAEGGRGIQVTVPGWPFEPTTETYPDGLFGLYNLTGGSYSISVERPTGGMRHHFDIELPDRDAGIEIVLQAFSVRGYVRTPEGVPLAGVQLVVERVRLDDQGRPQPSESVRADRSLYEAGTTRVVESASDGSFLIEDVDGNSPLVVTARSPWKTTTRSHVFRFDEGDELREINIAMKATGAVIARLDSPAINGLAYSVMATPLDYEGPRISVLNPGNDDQVVLHGLAPGRYRFEIESPSVSSRAAVYLPDPIEGAVVEGETLVLEFTGP